jgi:hypothetical protein
MTLAANAIDLTDTASVNSILEQVPATDADTIQAAITSYSQNILTRTGRGFLAGVRNYKERYNGNGSNEMLVRNYPILAVSSLSVNNAPVPASPDFVSAGFVIDTSGSEAAIAIIGGQVGAAWRAGDDRWGVNPGGWGSYGNAPPLGQSSFRFAQGIQNVAVEYTAGYTRDQIAEAQTVPATPGPYTKAVTFASKFYLDLGVTLADGTPLEAVAASPGPMQYVAPVWNSVPRGTYTFNAAQQGVVVNISYSYSAPPFDLAEAAGRLVAQMYRKRTWIGQDSQMQPNVGTTAYSKLEVEVGTAATIERYRMRFMP